MKVLYMDSRISDYTPGGHPIYDRPTSAADQRDINKAILSNGVYPNPSDNLQVMQGEGMAVLVKPGLCMVEGAPGIEVLTRTLLVQASHATFDRIDRVVARLNLAAENRSLDLFILQGTPAATPLAPALTRNNTVHEICLAELLIGHESTSVPQYKITDTRGDANLCGWIHGIVSQVDTSTIFNQYAAWLEFIQQQWEAWYAAKQSEFNTLLSNTIGVWEAWFDATKTAWLDWWNQQQDTSGYLTGDGEYTTLTTKNKKILRAINEVNAKGSESFVVSLSTTGWTQSGGRYTKTVDVPGVRIENEQIASPATNDMAKRREYQYCDIVALDPSVDDQVTFSADAIPDMEVVAIITQISKVGAVL